MKKNILFNFVTRFGAALLNLVISILISRELGNEVKGDHSLFIAGIALLQLFTNLFGGATLVYLAPRHNNLQLALLSCGWSLIILLPVWLVINSLNLIPAAYALSILFSSLLFAAWSNLGFILLGREQNNHYNLLQFLHPLVTTVLTFTGFYLYEKSLNSFALAYLLAQVFNLFLAFYFLRPRWHHLAKENNRVLAQTIFKHGFYIQLANFTQFFNYRLLFFLVDHFFGRAFLGVYSNAQSIAESVWMITRSISTIQFSKISNSSDDRENRIITRKYVSASFIVSALCLVVLLVVPPSFYSFLFGKGFENISGILFLLAPGILFLSVSNIFAHYFAGNGKNKVNFIGSFINLVALVTAFFILKNHTDSAAAPVAASFAYGSALFYHYLIFKSGEAKTARR